MNTYSAIRSLFICLLLLASASPAHPEPSNRIPPGQIDHGRVGQGPWNNDVLIYRVEDGGEAKKIGVFERAGVPTAARMKDGRLIAAFQNFPLGDQQNFDRVAVSFSDDEGVTWTTPASIRVEGMEIGLIRPFDPTLVLLPDGNIRLYFTSNRNRDIGRSKPAIYSGISSDGVNYTFEPGVRFTVEGRIVIDCAVALHNGVFHIIVPDNGPLSDLYGGRQKRHPDEGGAYHAISRDGLSFDRAADLKLPAGSRWLGNMQSDAGRVVFFGTGRGPWPVTSSDGVSWEPAGAGVRVPGADPAAVKLRDGSWLLLVTGPPVRSERPQN